jgi:hypothetical protein
MTKSKCKAQTLMPTTPQTAENQKKLRSVKDRLEKLQIKINDINVTNKNSEWPDVNGNFYPELPIVPSPLLRAHKENVNAVTMEDATLIKIKENEEEAKQVVVEEKEITETVENSFFDVNNKEDMFIDDNDEVSGYQLQRLCRRLIHM